MLLASCGNKLNSEWYPNGVGKDTVCTVGNGKFSLGKTSVGIDLSMYKDDGTCGVLLAFVEDYIKKGHKLYVYSKEGFCVVDYEQNTAKIFITVEKQYFSNVVGKDDAVNYLLSYSDFLEEERDMFDKLQQRVVSK